jgi:type I restriction enzyme S subunit
MTANDFLEQFATLADAPGGFKQLRSLFLELAFQGRFSSKGEVTSSWERKTLEEVSEILRPGFSCNRSNVTRDGHVHLRTHNVATDGKMNLDLIVRIDPAMVDSDKAALKKDDILFNNTNSQELVGKTCIVDADVEYGFSNHLTQIRLKTGYVASYVVRFLNLLWRRGYFASLCNRWIGQAGINTKALSIIEIPFPSEAEQKRIVAKVDRLMALCDALEAQQQARHAVRSRLHATLLGNLQTAANAADFARGWQRLRDHFGELFTPGEAALDAVAQLRQTILQLAVQGKLVPQDANDESAKRSFPGVTPLTSKSSDPKIFPDSWDLCTYRSLTSLVTSGSRGWKEFYSNKGAIFIRTQNIKTDSLILDDVAFVDLPTSAEGMRAQVLKDDILITVTGANVTKGARVKEPIPEAYVSQHIALTRPRWSKMSEWLHLCFISHGSARGTLEKLAYGDKPGLNLNNIRDLVLPIPPLAEQQRIVAKVQQLMARCDALEASLKEAATVSERWSAAAVRQLLDGAVR